MQLDWDDLKLFLAVARSGGLTAGAKDVAKSAPTLLRAINRLEESLRAPLFVRDPRGYALTAFGERVLEHALEAEGAIQRVSEAADLSVPQRVVRISAGTWTSKLLLRLMPSMQPALRDCLTQFITSEDAARIEHREVDIGLRNAPPAQRGLAGRKLFDVHYAVYAGAHTKESAGLPWIDVRADTPSARWVRKRDGARTSFALAGRGQVLDALKGGLGKYVLPTFIGDFEEGLARLPHQTGDLSHPSWMVLNDTTRHDPVVRRVGAALASALKRPLRGSV